MLDWGRGVWTCRGTWYWGSASGMVDGVPFGLNIGYGFGDTSAATENALFYGGKLHKLSQVTFHIPRKNGRGALPGPWTFDSDDRRFRMKFRPILDRAACPSAGVVRSGQHQVFGSFTGTAVLDDGTAVRLKGASGLRGEGGRPLVGKIPTNTPQIETKSPSPVFIGVKRVSGKGCDTHSGTGDVAGPAPGDPRGLEELMSRYTPMWPRWPPGCCPAGPRTGRS